MARHAALPETVVSLGVEEPVLGESGQLEPVIDIGGQHEEILALKQVQKLAVRVLGCRLVAIAPDIAAPVRPMLFERGVGMESCRVHVRKAVFLDEVGE